MPSGPSLRRSRILMLLLSMRGRVDKNVKTGWQDESMDGIGSRRLLEENRLATCWGSRRGVCPRWTFEGLAKHDAVDHLPNGRAASVQQDDERVMAACWDGCARIMGVLAS